MIYDVIVYLTDKAPDREESISNGPIDGKMTPTFQRLENLANDFFGSWVDWEPYRCTFKFAKRENSQTFLRAIRNDFGDAILAEFEEWEASE